MSMFSIKSLGFGLPSFLWASDSSHSRIDIPAVSVHEIEENPEKRARTLKHLLKANHINHSIIHHHLQFHNHAPHILGSAYLLGASTDQLNAIYDKESLDLEPWTDSPGEISRHDWRDFLGKREYARAFVDFFEDQLVQHGYDWRELLDDFLFQGKKPLINNLIAGLAHPLIHLGYAYELSFRNVAIEALGLVACFYNDMHKYLDDPSYTKPSSWTSTSPLEVLAKMSQDSRFDDMFASQGEANLDSLLGDSQKEALMLEYWNSWTITDPKVQFAQSQHAATALLVASHKTGEQYDFFLVHLLTSSHAVRIILPMIPTKFHVSLLRQWWLFVVSAYIQQLRPSVDTSVVDKIALKGRGWEFVTDYAINSKWATDAHFVKGCRAMQEAANIWGDEQQFYLKSAVKFAEDFNGWGGFGSLSQEEAEYLRQTHGYTAH